MPIPNLYAPQPLKPLAYTYISFTTRTRALQLLPRHRRPRTPRCLCALFVFVWCLISNRNYIASACSLCGHAARDSVVRLSRPRHVRADRRTGVQRTAHCKWVCTGQRRHQPARKVVVGTRTPRPRLVHHIVKITRTAPSNWKMHGGHTNTLTRPRSPIVYAGLAMPSIAELSLLRLSRGVRTRVPLTPVDLLPTPVCGGCHTRRKTSSS